MARQRSFAETEYSKGTKKSRKGGALDKWMPLFLGRRYMRSLSRITPRYLRKRVAVLIPLSLCFVFISCSSQSFPKQKFYENIAVTPAVKKAFVEQIRIIYWSNKIAATTLNLAAGEQVTEIEVFEVRLSAPKLDESVLRQIDREIPYHILFLLEYEGGYRAAIGYKEAAAGKTPFKVNRYYYTEWLEESELPVHLDGLSLDAVYGNFVRQIAGTAFVSDKSSTLKESVENQKQREQLEKQPKKKFELVQELNLITRYRK